jgi:hypothetical protein
LVVVARSRRTIGARYADVESPTIALVDQIKDVCGGLQPFQTIRLFPIRIRRGEFLNRPTMRGS